MIRGHRYAYHANDKQWTEYIETMFRTPGRPKTKTPEVSPKVVRANWMKLGAALKGK
jgi:hypothetical protein